MIMKVTDFRWKENFPGAIEHDQALQITCLGDCTPDYQTTTQPGLGLYQNQGTIALPLAGHTATVDMLLDRHHIIPDLYPLLEILPKS